MATRRQLALTLAAIFFSLGASYRTTNFVIEAPTQQLAQQVGQMAEYYRKEKAMQWLGREMPTWQEPCPVKVKVTIGGAGGATSFNFMHGQVWQTMTIEGSVDRLLASVLPHEITHTVFAHYYRCPMPRWADEGGAVLSEDDLERSRHDMMVRQILNAGRAIPLRRLFTLRDYPREVGSLYAEGYSVADFLVASSSRPVFLAFVAHGMQYDWDSAVQTHYRYPSVDKLEEAWLSHLKNTKRQPPTILARNTIPASADPAKRVIVRLTAPPVQPLQDMPTAIIRGVSPDVGAAWPDAAGRQAASVPGYLPDYNSVPNVAGHPGPGMQRPGSVDPRSAPLAIPQDPWQPPTVRLGTPQFNTQPAAATRSQGLASPVGYPN
jgi:hypothetical protein